MASVAALGVYVSRALPGQAASNPAPTSSGTTTLPTGSSGAPTEGAASGNTDSSGNTGTGNTGNSGSSGGLSAPTSPPARVQQQSPVVSGSS